MAVTSLKEYIGVARDRVENYGGKQIVYLSWDHHLLFAAPLMLCLPPLVWWLGIASPWIAVLLLAVGVLHFAGADERGEQTGLRDVGEVGGVAGGDADRELVLELTRTLVVDRGAGALLERLERVDVWLRLGVARDGGVDADRLAAQTL